MIKKAWEIYKKHREGFDYLIWGGIAFVLSMVLFWLFATVMGWNEVFANNVDWVICVIFTFITNKLFVFRSKAGSIKGLCREFVSFVLARVFTLVLEDIVIFVGCRLMGYNSGLGQMVVKLIAQFVVIVTNYILSKLIVFKKPKAESNATEAAEKAEAVEVVEE